MPAPVLHLVSLILIVPLTGIHTSSFSERHLEYSLFLLARRRIASFRSFTGFGACARTRSVLFLELLHNLRFARQSCRRDSALLEQHTQLRDRLLVVVGHCAVRRPAVRVA
jgi:hypothetical protein